MSTIRQSRMVQLIHVLPIDDQENIVLRLLANDRELERRVMYALLDWSVLEDSYQDMLAQEREGLLGVLVERGNSTLNFHKNA